MVPHYEAHLFRAKFIGTDLNALGIHVDSSCIAVLGNVYIYLITLISLILEIIQAFHNHRNVFVLLGDFSTAAVEFLTALLEVKDGTSKIDSEINHNVPFFNAQRIESREEIILFIAVFLNIGLSLNLSLLLQKIRNFLLEFDLESLSLGFLEFLNSRKLCN